MGIWFNVSLLSGAALAAIYFVLQRGRRDLCGFSDEALLGLSPSYFADPSLGTAAVELSGVFSELERGRSLTTGHLAKLRAFVSKVEDLNALDRSSMELMDLLVKSATHNIAEVNRVLADRTAEIRAVLGSRFTDGDKLEAWTRDSAFVLGRRVVGFLRDLKNHSTTQFDRELRQTVMEHENYIQALRQAEVRVQQLHSRSGQPQVACATAKVRAMGIEATTGLSLARQLAAPYMRERLQSVDSTYALIHSKDTDGALLALEQNVDEYEKALGEVTKLYNNNESLYTKARIYHTFLGYVLACIVSLVLSYGVAAAYSNATLKQILGYLGSNPNYRDLPLHNLDINECKALYPNRWQQERQQYTYLELNDEQKNNPAIAENIRMSEQAFKNCIVTKYAKDSFWKVYFFTFTFCMLLYHYSVPVINAYVYSNV